jgi:hypothetical protein
MNPEHENKIKDLSYIPVGLGKKNFSKNFLNDKNGKNISEKNPNYGEYTFHYWIWKNYLDQINTEWVGFCQYRKFFLKKKINEIDVKLNYLKESVITNIPLEFKNFDCILGEQFSVNKYKLKFFKKNLLKIILSPSVIFFKKKRNIKFHFDVFHGDGNLDAAIALLEPEDRKDFNNFVKTNTSFNPHNMFICKKKFLIRYYESLFPWLKRCESIFGFENLDGYGMKRIYGFLAERYLSYWFQKNSKVKELPIIVKDLSDYRNL